MKTCDEDMLLRHVINHQGELSYLGPGEVVGIGVLLFVVAILLILFTGLRRKTSPPRKGAESEGGAAGVSTVTPEAGYVLRRAGADPPAAPLPGGSSPGDSGCLGDGGPPQVMVRPNCHSPRRHGDRAGEWAASGEGSQVACLLWLLLLLLSCLSKS